MSSNAEKLYRLIAEDSKKKQSLLQLINVLLKYRNGIKMFFIVST